MVSSSCSDNGGSTVLIKASKKQTGTTFEERCGRLVSNASTHNVQPYPTISRKISLWGGGGGGTIAKLHVFQARPIIY